MKFPRFTPRLLQAVLGIVLAGFSVFPDVHARQPELLIINDYIDFIPRGHDPLDFDASGNLSGDYIKLLFVDSVAARGNDIFVADTTQRKIFRIDSIQRTISEFATLGPGIGTDLYVSDAFSLFVIDNQAGRVIEYFRDGRKIREFGNDSNLSRAIAVAEGQNNLMIADRVGGRIAVFNSLGGLSRFIGQNINLEGSFGSITDMVADDRFIYLLDQASRKILIIDYEGNILLQFGQDKLKQPVAMSMDHCQRIYVADQFDNSIHVFLDDIALAEFHKNDPALNGILMITDIWIDQETMYISDGVTGRIRVLRIDGGC